jgi:L-serine/L-threonine ammonia-lyase
LLYTFFQFAQDHRLLVEPACGAALAVIYSQLFDFSSLQERSNNEKMTVVVEICGGSGVSLDLLQGWRNEYCNGGVDDKS